MDNNINNNLEQNTNNLEPQMPVENTVLEVQSVVEATPVEATITEVPTMPEVTPVEVTMPEVQVIPETPTVETVIPEMPEVTAEVPTTTPEVNVDAVPEMPTVTPEVTVNSIPDVNTVAETPVQTEVTPQTSETPTTTDTAQTPAEQLKKSKSNIIVVILLLAVIVGAVVYAVIHFVSNKEDNKNDNTKLETTTVKNVQFGSRICVNDVCSYGLTDADGSNSTEYVFEAENEELFSKLSDYAEMITVDIKTAIKDDKKLILGYQIYKTGTEEEIKVSDANELRTQLGLYAYGNYTEKLTLKGIDTTPGVGINEEESYAYFNITFVNEKDMELEMKYMVHENEEMPKLEDYKVGDEYTVTFKVSEGAFDVEYTIVEVK